GAATAPETISPRRWTLGRPASPRFGGPPAPSPGTRTGAALAPSLHECSTARQLGDRGPHPPRQSCRCRRNQSAMSVRQRRHIDQRDVAARGESLCLLGPAVDNFPLRERDGLYRLDHCTSLIAG